MNGTWWRYWWWCGKPVRFRFYWWQNKFPGLRTNILSLDKCYQRFARCNANRSMAFDLDLVVVDPENFVSDFLDAVSYEFDEFFHFEKQVQKLDEELKIFQKESQDSFYLSILYAIYYHLLKKKEDFDFRQDQERLCEISGWNFFENLKLKKHSLQLDLSFSAFETQCHFVNDLSMEKNLFLRVYEFRKKFRYLIKKMPRGKTRFRGNFQPALRSVSTVLIW